MIYSQRKAEYREVGTFYGMALRWSGCLFHLNSSSFYFLTLTVILIAILRGTPNAKPFMELCEILAVIIFTTTCYSAFMDLSHLYDERFVLKEYGETSQYIVKSIRPQIYFNFKLEFFFPSQITHYAWGAWVSPYTTISHIEQWKKIVLKV